MKFKIGCTLFILLLCYTNSKAQPAQKILQRAYEKCLTIKNGYYEMTTYFKMEAFEDTSTTKSNNYFKKLPNDSLYLSAFRYFNNDNLNIYNGENFVEAYFWDSTATIINSKLWPEISMKKSYQVKEFTPISNDMRSSIHHNKDFLDTKNTYEYIGEEKIKNEACYHVKIKTDYGNNDTSGSNIRFLTYNFWIKTADYLPIQFTTAITSIYKRDTTYQYEKKVLDKYELNNLKDDSIFKLSSIPQFFKIKMYSPIKETPLLAVNSRAPSFNILSLNNKNVSLKKLKGKLVLLDFFFKDCPPCKLAIPELQKLHTKYKAYGLHVIGINNVDKIKSVIIPFLANVGVTYNVLLNANEVTNKYNVTTYPTLYLINKMGKIIYSFIGYDKSQERILEALIINNL